MKIKVISIAILMSVAVLSMSGCKNEPQNSYLNEYSAPVSRAAAPDYEDTMTISSSEPQVVKEVTLDDVAASFVGYALDDVSNAFKESNKANLFSYESDNGKKIMVKNNWAVSDYRIEGEKIVFVCTKFRNDGIVDAVKENSEGLKAAASLLRMLR